MWLDPAANDASPRQLVMKGEMALNLADVLERLPDGQREAVRMRHLKGRRLEEIAEHLQKSTVATAGLIKRGLQALRKAMPETDW